MLRADTRGAMRARRLVQVHFHQEQSTESMIQVNSPKLEQHLKIVSAGGRLVYLLLLRF